MFLSLIYSGFGFSLLPIANLTLVFADVTARMEEGI